MHQSVMDFVAAVVEQFGLRDAKNVMEIGSYDVNGSVRGLFAASATPAYVGVDARHGPGVDLVHSSGYPLPFPDGRFDVAVSTETLEHDRRPWLTVAEMGRLIKPDGIVIVTARGFGFPQHDYPSDYWRFTPEGLFILLQDAGLRVVGTCADPDPTAPGVLGIARKLVISAMGSVLPKN